MDLLGVGPFELILVLVLIILVFGPEDMAKAGKKIGQFLNQVIKSDTWKAVQAVSKEIRTLPNKLAREAEYELYLAENEEKTIAPPDFKSSEPKTQPTKPEENLLETGLEAWTTPPAEKPNEEEE